jgi:hypothetical protein
MTTTDPGDDAAQLKGRRRTAAARSVRTVQNTILSQAPDTRPDSGTVGAAMRRSSKVLFQPGEQPAVMQAGGFAPEATLIGDYVRAECDVTESFVPKNARTPVSRILWCKGALVRRDIYELHLATLEPVVAPASGD